MPAFDLSTNVTVEDPKAFCVQFSKLAAEVLGKPEAYISVHLDHGKHLTFGGSFEPAFLLTIMSLGMTDSGNAKISDRVVTFLKDKLGIPGDRGYIYNNTTFGQMWK